MAVGFINQIVTLVMPFVIRTIIINKLGDAYSGLNGLFSSILQVLSLAELGFATAMVFSMYRPVAEDNTDLVCALLKLYKTVYLVIGAVVLAIGLVLLPFLPKLINPKTEIPADINLYTLFLLYLFNSVSSYFFFAYKSSVLVATARSDISTLVTMLCCLVQYTVQIVVLIVFHNFYVYFIFSPIFSILANCIKALIVGKMYPQYVCRGVVDKASLASIKKNIGGLIFHRVGSVVVNATDTIVIGKMFENALTEITMFTNYQFISSAVSGFMIVIYNAISATVGNAIVTKTKEDNYKDFMKFTFMNLTIVGWCSICLFCLYQPFMNLWMPGRLYKSMLIIACFCMHFYFYRARGITTQYKSAVGIFWQDRWCPIVSSAVNLGLDILLGKLWGIPGILMATVFAMLFIETPWELTMLYKHYFKRPPWEFIGKWFLYLVVTIGVCAVTYFVTSLLPMPVRGEGNILECFMWLFVKLGICIVIPTTVYTLVYFHTEEFKASKDFVVSFIKRRKQHG